MNKNRLIGILLLMILIIYTGIIYAQGQVIIDLRKELKEKEQIYYSPVSNKGYIGELPVLGKSFKNN